MMQFSQTCNHHDQIAKKYPAKAWPGISIDGRTIEGYLIRQIQKMVDASFLYVLRDKLIDIAKRHYAKKSRETATVLSFCSS